MRRIHESIECTTYRWSWWELPSVVSLAAAMAMLLLKIDYLRSHFRAQTDSWRMRLDLDDESFLENQSPVCQRAFLGVLTAQRHRLNELARQFILEESLVQKRAREIDHGRNSHQIDLERALNVKNVLTEQSTIS